MRDNLSPAPLMGGAPREYDPKYITQLVRAIEVKFANVLATGPARVSTLNISNLPISDTGLRPGDLWNDSDTVKVVT